MKSQVYKVTGEMSGSTLAAALRQWLPGQSWKAVRQLVASRHILIRDEVCLDPARRLPAGESVEVRSGSAPRPLNDDAIIVRFADKDLVVVEKPSGMCTVRHPTERDWPEHRKRLSATLEDLVPRILGAHGESIVDRFQGPASCRAALGQVNQRPARVRP